MPYKDPEQRRAHYAAFRRRPEEMEKQRIRNAVRREAYKATSPCKFRAYQLARYGLTPEAFGTMLAEQDMACAARGSSDWGALGPMVDHDHKTDVVRGILCCRCNSAIGYLRDDPRAARRIADYLEKNNA